jgi:hypothetical protein
MKTPIQQLKENYYKMSESEFHYWMSQNIETLLEKERDIIVGAYNRDVINKKQNWAIENGERYYNLHYKGDQVGISGKEEQVGKTNPDYTFEDGV